MAIDNVTSYGNLTTRSLYNAFDTWTGSTSALDYAIEFASEAVQRYLNRDLEYDTYFEWLNGTGGSTIQVENYPIRDVVVCTNDTRKILTFKSNAAISGKNMVFEVRNEDFSDGTTDKGALYFKYRVTEGATPPEGESYFGAVDPQLGVQWGALYTKITLDSNWTDEFDFSGYDVNEGFIPIGWIKPNRVMVTRNGQNIDLYAANPNTVTEAYPDPEAEKTIVASCLPRGFRNIFCEYTAGYVLPVDNSEGTALEVEGDLPKVITWVTNNVIRDVQEWDDGNSVGLLNSEREGDYSYSNWDWTKNPEATQLLTQAVSKYSAQLSKYKNVTLHF